MVVEGQRFERKGHALPDIKQILADERVSFEKHKDVEPYGALFIEGVDDVQPEDKARLERAINQIAAYTDGILIKDYFEQRHLEQDGRRAWRRMMYERLAPYPDLLRQFRHLIMFDKMRRGTMDRFVVR